MNIERLKESQRNRDFDSFQIKEFFKYEKLTSFNNKRVLEVGCGNARTLIGLKNKINAKVYGCDILDIDIVENKNQINFVNKNIFDMSLSDVDNDGFDFIYSFRMFLYLEPEQKLKLFRKLYSDFLKIGGVLLIDFTGDVRKNSYSETTKEDLKLISYLMAQYNERLELITLDYPFEQALTPEVLFTSEMKGFRGTTLRIVKK